MIKSLACSNNDPLRCIKEENVLKKKKSIVRPFRFYAGEQYK